MATGQTLIRVDESEPRSVAAAPSARWQRVAVAGSAFGAVAVGVAIGYVARDTDGNADVHELVATMLRDSLPAAKLGDYPTPVVDPTCFVKHCLKEFLTCGAKSVLGEPCIATLACESGCNDLEKKVGHNRAPGCAYLCEMTTGYKSPAFTDLMVCGKENKCLPTYPTDGHCMATDADALQNITSLDQVEGDWWVIKGLNCGQVADGTPFHPGMGYPALNPTKGKDFPGGYDWYPCQHERFVKSTGKDYPNPTTPWVNNITYCGGANGGLKECNTSIIDTVANVTMCAPGVVCHTYTDSPLKPQFEHWRIISWPHPDYMFTFWCGGTPLLDYNGGITLSKHRTGKDMPKWVEENFRQTAKRFGVDFDQMCPSTNEGCP